MFPSILIVDDEPSILKSLVGILTDEGFKVTTALNGYEALKIIDIESPDLVLLDIWMPGIDGIETLKQIKKDNPYIQVIIITGHGTIETAIQATKLGAYDLIEKPLSIDKIILGINNALNFRRLEEENKYLRKKTMEKHSITGNSASIQELKKQIAMVAPSNTWVLITGENGSGKELVARNIHQLSNRVDYPLIDVSSAAIAEDLIEIELFGHEKGAFPGATGKKRGKFELAEKGTLFLDEIGDMNLKTQAKILRVLQEKQFQRLGSDRIIDVDVRVIAATNKNLEKEIEKGNFREELFHRLNVVPIRVPSLRERIEDLPLLADIFLDEYAKKSRGRRKYISKAALDLFAVYHWPGNVRELKNLIERLMIMVGKDTIDAEDLPETFHPQKDNQGAVPSTLLFQMSDLNDAKRAFEFEFISYKLKQNDQDIEKTAKTIGVDADYLKKWLKKKQPSQE
ncbi:MAG: sigma-54 dependent transcriptional regulator [Desulfobacterales bacterium]